MARDFSQDYQTSAFLADATETATIPVTAEYFTASHAAMLADEIVGLQYSLGLPGLRNSASAPWGVNYTIGTATGSGTSLVFTATQTVVKGWLVAGASPTSTGWRRITTSTTGLTATVDSAFTVAPSAEAILRHGTVAERIDTIETDVSNADFDSRVVSFSIIRDAGDTDHDLEFTFNKADGTTDVVTKLLDATWAAGDNAGGMYSGDSLPTSGYVVCWYVRSAAGVNDIVVRGNTMTAPTLSGVLAGYTFRSPQPVAMTLTDSIANLRTFTYDSIAGSWDMTDTLALDVSQATDTARDTLTAVNAPPNVMGKYRAFVQSSGVTVTWKVESLVHTDQAPGEAAALGSGYRATTYEQFAESIVRLDASRQFAFDASAGTGNVLIQFTGWLWRPNL